MGKPQACYYCGRPSSVLCDGVLALYSENGLTISRKAINFTCDRPMCKSCVKETSMIHFNMKPKHVWDSRDYCPDCVKEGRHSLDAPTKLASMEEGRALQRRRLFHAKMEVHARAGGDPFAIAGSLPPPSLETLE